MSIPDIKGDIDLDLIRERKTITEIAQVIDNNKIKRKEGTENRLEKMEENCVDRTLIDEIAKLLFIPYY
jgi:hypothetical protein